MGNFVSRIIPIFAGFRDSWFITVKKICNWNCYISFIPFKNVLFLDQVGLEECTMHLKLNLTRVWTYDLQIMTVYFASLRREVYPLVCQWLHLI